MTNKAILLVTRILQNRNLLECTGVARFKEDEDGYVTGISFPSVQADGAKTPEYKIRVYEKPDQRHGVIFRFEFHEGTRPYFTVEDYLRNGKERTTFLKKTESLQEPKMDRMLLDMNNMIQTTYDSMNHIGRYLIGAYQ